MKTAEKQAKLIGRWLITFEDAEKGTIDISCSKCHARREYKKDSQPNYSEFYYCPNCGAEMKNEPVNYGNGIVLV